MSSEVLNLLFGGLGITFLLVIYNLGRYSMKVDGIEKEMAKVEKRLEERIAAMRQENVQRFDSLEQLIDLQTEDLKKLLRGSQRG